MLEEQLASLRAAVAALRPRGLRTFTLVGVCALIVAVGPVALTLSRNEYHASSSIRQRVDLPDYTRTLEIASALLVMGAIVNSRDAQQAVVDDLAWLDSRTEVTESVKLTGRWRGGRPEVVITARASALDDAEALARAAAHALSERAERGARRKVLYQRALRDGGLAFYPPVRERADKERLVDSALAALPGRLPPSPDPTWAAVAGVALAAALVLAVVALGPRSPKRRQNTVV